MGKLPTALGRENQQGTRENEEYEEDYSADTISEPIASLPFPCVPPATQNRVILDIDLRRTTRFERNVTTVTPLVPPYSIPRDRKQAENGNSSISDDTRREPRLGNDGNRKEKQDNRITTVNDVRSSQTVSDLFSGLLRGFFCAWCPRTFTVKLTNSSCTNERKSARNCAVVCVETVAKERYDLRVPITLSNENGGILDRKIPRSRKLEIFPSSFAVSPRYPRLISHFFLFTLLAMSLLCVSVSGVPTPTPGSPYTTDIHDRNHLDRFEDVFENHFEENELATTRNALGEDEFEIIRRSIVHGLGLRSVPDPSKANISQSEYERAHREYLNRMESQEEGSRDRINFHVFYATERRGNTSVTKNEVGLRRMTRGTDSYRHSLYFPVEIAEENTSVDHASLRLFLEGDKNMEEGGSREVEGLLYLITRNSRRLIARKRIDADNPGDSRWIEFDSTDAVSHWLEDHHDNLGLEIEFVREESTPVRRTFSFPVLNVFAVSPPNGRRKRSSPEELMSLHKGRRTKCKGESKKCCRHELTVMFKDLKGFEFIVYPKTFDAGYCKGRCPPRYNPAHHHALLQSLLWKEDKKKVPKPCCAPSKLDQLMIVYFDENDTTELKVSYWKNIQVLECACS